MMATGIVQEAYQQLHADVQHLITLQEAVHGSNTGNGKAGGIRSGSSHPKEKNGASNGESVIVSRARNQIQHQLAVLKRSILSVRLNSNGTSIGHPLSSKVNHPSASAATNGNLSSPAPIGKLKHSVGGGRGRNERHRDASLETQRSRADPLAASTEGERTAHSHSMWSTETIARGNLGTSAFTKPVYGRSSTAPLLAVATDGMPARLSSLSPIRTHLSEMPDVHGGTLAYRHHLRESAVGPSRVSSVGHKNSVQAKKNSFESHSRYSIPPQIATAVPGAHESSGAGDSGAGKEKKEVSFSGDMKNALSPSWGSDGEGIASAMGNRKAVIHHVDHAAAQEAMKMRRGYSGFGSGGGTAAVAAATSVPPITGTAVTTGMEANKGSSQSSPMLSSPSKPFSPRKKNFGRTEGSKGNKKKKVGKDASFSKEKLLKRPPAGTSFIKDGSPDPMSPGLKMRLGDVTVVANTATGALPTANVEATLAVVRECHEYAARFLHLGLCKDAKILFLDSVSDDVMALSRIAAAVVPSVDEKGRTNGQVGGGVDDPASGVERMKGNDEARKGMGSKSGSAPQSKKQAKKTSALLEEELPLALQAYLRAFQHELLTAVASFYNILNNDPFLDTMAETVMCAARQVEVVVDVLYRMLSTPSLYAGNTPAVWDNCKMSALQPYLSVPTMTSGALSAYPLGSGDNASNRAETTIHGNLIVAEYLLSDLLAVREEGVPTTSFPDGSQRQEKRYDVAESGYYMLFNGSIYVYEMSMYLLHRVENCRGGSNTSGNGWCHEAMGHHPVECVEPLRKGSTMGGRRRSSAHHAGHRGTSTTSTRTPHPAAEAAAVLLPDLYRCCMRHVGACMEMSDARQSHAMLKLATAKYLPWRLKMYDFLMQCMESMHMYTEANQMAQQAAQSVRFLLELECSDPVPPPPACLNVLEHAAQHTMLQMMRYGWYELIANAWRQRCAGTSGGEGNAPLGNPGEGGGGGGSNTAFQAISPTGNLPSGGTISSFSSGAGGVLLSGGASSTSSSSLCTVFTILPEHSSVSTVHPMPGPPSAVSHGAGATTSSTSAVALGEGYGVSVTVSFPHHGRELLDLIWCVIEKASLPFALHQKKLDTSATAAAFAAASSVVNTGNTRGGHKKAGGNATSGGAASPVSITMEQIDALKAARREEEVQHMQYVAQQFQRHILSFLIGFFVYHPPLEMDTPLSPAGIGWGSPMMSGGGGGIAAEGGGAPPEHVSKGLHARSSSPGPGSPGVKSGGIGSSSAKESSVLALLRFSHLRQCAMHALEILLQYMSIQYFKDPLHRPELLRGDTFLYPFPIRTASAAEESDMRVSTQAYLDEIQAMAIEEATAGAVVSSAHGRAITPRDRGVIPNKRVGGGAPTTMNGREFGSMAGGKRGEGGWNNERAIFSALQQLRTPPKESVSITEDPDFIRSVQFENYFPIMWARNYQVQQRFKSCKPVFCMDPTETSVSPEVRKTTQTFLPTNSMRSSAMTAPSAYRGNVDGRAGNTESTVPMPSSPPMLYTAAGTRSGLPVRDTVEDHGSHPSPMDPGSKTKKNGLVPILMGLSTAVSERDSASSTMASAAYAPTPTDRSLLLLPIEDELQKELLCMLQAIRHLYGTQCEALFYRCGAALIHFLRGTMTGHKGTVGGTDFGASLLSCGGGTTSPPKSRSHSPASGLTVFADGGAAGAEVGDGHSREGDKRAGGGRSPSPTSGAASSSALAPMPEGRSKDALSRTPRDGAAASLFGEAGVPNLSVASQLQWNRLAHSATYWIHLLQSLRYSVLIMRFQKRTLQTDEVLLLGSYYVPPTHPLLSYFIRSGGYLPDVGRLVAQAKKAELQETQALQLAAMGGGGGMHGRGSGRSSAGSGGRSDRGTTTATTTHSSRVPEREEGKPSHTGQEGGGALGGTEDLHTAARFGSASPSPAHPYPLVSPLLPAATALRALAHVLSPGGASTRFFRENPLLGFHSSGSVAIAAVYEEVILSVGNFLIEAATESIQHRRKEKRARKQHGITALLFQDPEQLHMGPLSGTISQGAKGGCGVFSPSWAEKTGVQDFLSPLVGNEASTRKKSGIHPSGWSIATPTETNTVRTKPPLRTEDEVDEEEERAYFDVVVNGISGLVASGLTNEMNVGEFAIQLASSALEDLSAAEERRRKESEEGNTGGGGDDGGGGGGLAGNVMPTRASPGEGEKEGGDVEAEHPVERSAGQMLNRTLLRAYTENGVADMVGPYLQKMGANANGRGLPEEDAAEGGPLRFGALRFMDDVSGSRQKPNEVQTIKLLERSRLALSFVKTALSIVATRHRHFTESGILPTAAAGTKVPSSPPLGTEARSGGTGEGGGEENGRKGEAKKPSPHPPPASSGRPPAEAVEAGGEPPQTKAFSSPSFYRSPPSKVFSVFQEHVTHQHLQEDKVVVLGNALRDYRTYLTRFVVELRYHVACLRAQVSVYEKHHEDIIRLLERHRNTKVFGAVTVKDARILQTLLSEEPELPETTEEEEAKLLNWSARDPALHALVLLCLANVLPSHRHRRERLDAAMDVLRSLSHALPHQPHPTDPYSLIIIWGFAASTSSTLRAMAHSSDAKKVLYQYYLSCSSSSSFASCFSAITTSYSERCTDLSEAEAVMKSYLHTNEKVIESSSELALLNFSGALMDLAAAEMETSRRRKNRIDKENPPEPYAVAIGKMSNWEWSRQHQITGLFSASSTLLALRLLECISSSAAASRLIFPCVNLMFNCLLPCLSGKHFNTVVLLPLVSMAYVLLDFDGEGWQDAEVQLLALRILQALKTHLALGGVAGRGMTLQEQRIQCALTQLLYITFAHVWNGVLQFPNMRQRRYFQHVQLEGLRARQVYARSVLIIQPEENPEAAATAVEVVTGGGRGKSKAASTGSEKSGPNGGGGRDSRSVKASPPAERGVPVPGGGEEAAEAAEPSPESMLFPGSPLVPSPSQPHLYDQVPVEFLELMEELLFHDPVMGCTILPLAGAGSGAGSGTSRRAPAAAAAGGGGGGGGGGAPTTGGGRALGTSTTPTGSHSPITGTSGPSSRSFPPSVSRSKHLVEDIESRVHLEKLLRPEPLMGIPPILLDTISTLGNCLSGTNSTTSNSGSSSGGGSSSGMNASVGGSGGGSALGGGAHMAPVVDVLAKHTGDLVYSKVVHRTMECLLRLEDFSTAKAIGTLAMETFRTLEGEIRQWLLRLHHGFFSWLALNGYILADSRRIQEEKEAEERRKALEIKATKEAKSGRKSTSGRESKTKKNTKGEAKARTIGRKGNKRSALSPQVESKHTEEEDDMHFLDIPRVWNSAEEQMLRQTTRALGWIRRRRADRFMIRRLTAFYRLVSSQIRLYLAAISKLETMEIQRKRKYQEERWQHLHAKSLFGGEGGGGAHGGGSHSHFQEGKIGTNAGEKGSPFTTLAGASFRGTGSGGGSRKGANVPSATITEESQEQTHQGYKVFTEHCANAAAILNNAFLSSQAMRAVCMALNELQNGALANVPNAYLLAMREERHVDHSPSVTSMNSLNDEREEVEGEHSPLAAEIVKGSALCSPADLPKANPPGSPALAGKGMGSPPHTVAHKEGGMSGEEKWDRPHSRTSSPNPVPLFPADPAPTLDGETMKRLQELSPLLIRLATELLFSLTSIQRGYCDHRRDIEVIQPTATKTGIFCCLAEQIHFQGFVPSLYAVLSPAGQFEERRIGRLAPREHEKTKRVQRRRLQECITAEEVSRGACVKAYKKHLIAILNPLVLQIPSLRKHREPLLYDEQDDSSEHVKNTLAENLLILHSQAHRNGDIYCTMDAHEAHDTLRRAAMNCPSLVHFPFELPGTMTFTKEERIRQLQLGHDLPEEVIIEMIVFLASGMQFTAQRETLDLCSVANEVTNHRFASVLLPIAMYVGNSIGTTTADLYKALDSIKNVVSTGKAALTTAQLNWKWYVGTTQYQRVLKRFFHSLFPHFSSTKKKDVEEEYASGFRPLDASESRKMLSIEEYHSNESFMNRASILTQSDAGFLAGSNVIHVKTVLSSYHRAASRLRESRDFGALSECLLELGQVYLLHRNKAEAEMTWLEALDAAVEIPRVLFNWRTTVLWATPRGGSSLRIRSSSPSRTMPSSVASPSALVTAAVGGGGASLLSSLGGQRVPSCPLTGRSSSSPGMMPAGGLFFVSIFSSVEDALSHAPSFSVESIGLTRLFMALCSLSSLAMFAYREDQEKAIDCYLLAASMVWFFFRRGATVNFPERLYDFVDFSMHDMVVTMYLEESMRPKIPLIVHHLLFLSHELLQIRYFNFAGMMGSLTEYMCMRYLQDAKLVIEARLIRAKAAAGGGNFGSAMRLLRRICQGAQLPTSLFAVLSVPSRSSVVDCCAAHSGTGSGPTEKSGGKGGGTSAVSVALAAASAALPGDGSASAGYSTSPNIAHLPGALGAGGRSVGKDLERRLYNDEELPTSPGNVQSISTFVMDCFPHIYMDPSSGVLSMQGGGGSGGGGGGSGTSGGAGGGGSSGGGAGGASSMSGSNTSSSGAGGHSPAAGAGSTSASSPFLHEEVCERYGMLLSRRVVLAVAEMLVMLGGREAAYLWPYDMSPVTGVAWATAAASIPAGGGPMGGSGPMSGVGGGSTSSGGGTTSGSSSGGGDTGSSARRSASREVRPSRNAVGGTNSSHYGGGGGGTGGTGGGGGGGSTGSGAGPWIPQRSACTEALKAGEFLLEPFLQKEVFHLSSPSSTLSSTNTGKKGSGIGGGGGGKGSGAFKQGGGGHNAIKGGVGAAGMAGGRIAALPGSAAATDIEQDSSFLAYQQRLEESGCLRHHATVLKAMAISERGHSRLAISLLEEEIREYNRSIRSKPSLLEVGNASYETAPSSGENRGNVGGVSPKRRRSGEVSPTHASTVPRSALAETTHPTSARRNTPRKGAGSALPTEGPSGKKKTIAPPTPVGLGFSIEKFSNIPSFILAFSHTHWCRVWYVLTVNYFRLRAFRKMEKAAQQGILLCQRCNDPFFARIFSLYRAAALAQTGFLKEALETVKALEEATVKLSVGHTDPYEAWSMMAVEWLKRMVLVQEGSGGAVAGSVGDLSSEGIWPTVLPLLQHYAEFCGLLPWRIEEDESNPNFFSWKVHKTSNTSISACRAKESIKLHTVMNAAAEMKLHRYLGRKPLEESGAALSFTGGVHLCRPYTSGSASGGNALIRGASKSKRKPLASGVAGGVSVGCGALVLSKSGGGGGGTLAAGQSLYHSPHYSPPGSPRVSKNAGGGGDGAGAMGNSSSSSLHHHLVPSSWKADLMPAIDLLEQAIQGLSSQYDTRAYPSLLVESKLLLAQALLLCRYPAQEDYGRGPPLLQCSVLPVLYGDGSVGVGEGGVGHEDHRGGVSSAPLRRTDAALPSRSRKHSAGWKSASTAQQGNFPASEDLTRESSVTRARQSKSAATARRESGDMEEEIDTSSPEHRSISTASGLSGKQRRKGGGKAASLPSQSHSEEVAGRNSSGGGAGSGGGGGMLSSSQRVRRTSSLSLSPRSSLPTSADVAECVLSKYIPVGRVQQICKLLLETAESTVASGTHDFRVLRLALLELATLLSRYALPPSLALPLDDEEEERESSGGSDSDSAYGRRSGGSGSSSSTSSGGSPSGPLSAVGASCTILAYLAQQMMHHVSSGANEFHIYNMDESSTTDSFSLQERFPDFVVAAIHSTIHGVGRLDELSSTEHAVMEQPHRLSLDSPMTMTVSSFYTDLLVANGAEGAGSGKRGGGVGGASAPFHPGTFSSIRGGGSGGGGGGGHNTSAPPFMMMNDGNGVLPTSSTSSASATTGNSISIYTPSPMPITLQDIAHTFATLQRERGLYMLAPPQEALDHETALMQLKSYLQEKTTPPSCTYLYYSNELRRQWAKQLLLAKMGGGGLTETGGAGGGSATTSGGVGFRGGNKKDHLNVTQQQQQQDNIELWNAFVPPLLFKTLPPFFFSPIGPDCLGASKVNSVVTASFVSASYDGLRQGYHPMPGTEEAGMVTLLVSVSPYHDPSLTQPPSIATAADRKRLLVPMTRDLNSHRASNALGERASSSGSAYRATSSGSLGGGTQFKNRLAIAQVQLEARTVHVDGAFQDRLQELSQMDSSMGAGAQFGICGPGYDPENENSRKGLWTCVTFELPKKVVEELHRQALQVLRWYALEESDRRKHPECAAAAATGGAVGGGGTMMMKDIPFPSSPEGGGVSSNVGSPLGTVAVNGSGGGFLSGKGQAMSNHSSIGYGSGGLPGSGNAVGSNSSGVLPTAPLGPHLSPATCTLYGALQQSLLSLQQKCQQQQLSHLIAGGGGTTKKGGGSGGAGGGSASGSSAVSGAPSAPRGLLGDTSAIFLTGLMNGANGYLSGGVGGGSILSSSAHGSGGTGTNSGSTSERGSGGGSSSVHFTLPGAVGGTSVPTSGSSGSQGNSGNGSSTFLPRAYSGGGGSNTVGFSGDGAGGGSGGFSASSFSCDLTERYYQQQQAARMEESKRIIQRLDECKSLLLMNWIESIVKNYVARSMADETLMESCVQQLLPTCAFSNEVVEFLARWLTNDGGSATFFHPGVHSWMRKISNFIVKMRRGSVQ